MKGIMDELDLANTVVNRTVVTVIKAMGKVEEKNQRKTRNQGG